MVELKSLSSPKVAVPVIGIIVLIVVSSLVAVFYIRNPTVTDGIFGANQDETTSSTFSVQSDGMPSDHGSQSTQMGNQSSHSMQSTTPGNHDHAGNSTSGSAPSATAATLPTTTPSDSSTPMHAIEPVQHL